MKRADRALREAGRSALVERANVRIDIVADKAKGLLHRQTSLNSGPHIGRRSERANHMFQVF